MTVRGIKTIYAIKTKMMVQQALHEFVSHIRCVKGPRKKIAELTVDVGTAILKLVQ